MLISSMLAVSLISCAPLNKKVIPPPKVIQKKIVPRRPLEKRIEGTRLKDVYGYDSVHLKDFYDLTFENTDKNYKIPTDLEEAIDLGNVGRRSLELENKEEFRKKILGIAEELEYSEKKIKSLQPLEALELVGNIVVENYEYKQINYDGKTIDQIFETREIKCTDYMYSVIAVFDLMKEMNPNLNNVYVRTHLFSRYIGHAWNTIVVMGKKDVQIAYFDATWYDTEEAENFNATDRWHIDFERWRSQLYADLGDYDAAQKELKPLISKTKSKIRLEQLLERSAYYYFLADEYDASLKMYKQLADEFPKSKDMDEYIYYLGLNYFGLGDYEHMKECIEILKNQYPKSPYKLDYLEKYIK